MKRIITIFAGREKYLSILKLYLDALIKNDSVTEVHLWNYARNDGDYEYVENICKNNERYILFSPDKSYKQKINNKWHEYYSYYINTDLHDNDILIKCDDDIVYIDVANFERYISQITEDILYFPNIVNNDVGAYIQTKNGVHDLLPAVDEKLLEDGCITPLSGWKNGWYQDKEMVEKIHNHFLNNVDKYSLEMDNMEWSSRISINLFAGNVKTMKHYFRLYESIGKGDDEAFFSARVCQHMNKKNKIIPFFVVVHFSFNPQHTEKLNTDFLPGYRELALSL